MITDAVFNTVSVEYKKYIPSYIWCAVLPSNVVCTVLAAHLYCNNGVCVRGNSLVTRDYYVFISLAL